MPSFCRHNRFIERCPICSKTLPGFSSEGPSRPASPARAGSARAKPARARTRSGGAAGARAGSLRVHREQRAADDGYRCELVAGLRSSADAARLARELAFASARVLALVAEPRGLYAEVRALAREDRERATWMCFLTAYLCPLEGEDPFAGIRLGLQRSVAGEGPAALGDPGELPLGPRSSHEPGRAGASLEAYADWVARWSAGAAPAAGLGPQALAFTGDPSWSAQRRFERIFERLALPGLTRVARFELLVLLGRLGVYELACDALHFAPAARGGTGEDEVTLAAKRAFGIGEPLLLERRAAALAEAAAVPLEALDLALWNWSAPAPATLGFPRAIGEGPASDGPSAALGL